MIVSWGMPYRMAIATLHLKKIQLLRGFMLHVRFEKTPIKQHNGGHVTTASLFFFLAAHILPTLMVEIYSKIISLIWRKNSPSSVKVWWGVLLQGGWNCWCHQGNRWCMKHLRDYSGWLNVAMNHNALVLNHLSIITSFDFPSESWRWRYTYQVPIGTYRIHSEMSLKVFSTIINCSRCSCLSGVLFLWFLLKKEHKKTCLYCK